MYTGLRLAAGLAALAAVAARLQGVSLAEILGERLAYPGGLLERLRERFGRQPPATPTRIEHPVEKLKREIQKSGLSHGTKEYLLDLLRSGRYSEALQAYQHALAAPLRL